MNGYPLNEGAIKAAIKYLKGGNNMPEITPEQAREWFANIDKAFPNTYYRHEDGTQTPLSLETIYQAFKTRLIEETTCCELPKEGK